MSAARGSLTAAIEIRDGIASVAQRILADRYVDRRRRDLEAALAEHVRATAAHDRRLGSVDEARLTLARARAERELIERHFARWREDRRKLAERRED